MIIRMGDSSNVARNRWRILAKALSRSSSLEEAEYSDLETTTSLRRFQSYGLVHTVPLENIQESQATWFEYLTNISQYTFSVLIRHPKQTFTAADLMGFNNTGNVCVWPSEEVLAFYCLSNRHLFSGKSVLELGGGMSCLAGLLIAKYTSAAKVLLTDGNETAMDNVKKILDRNELAHVSWQVLQWGKHPKMNTFDLILCADCLFFDEVRFELVQTIYDMLSHNGVALVTAPQRGDTLTKFCQEACSSGLICALHKKYNQQVWECHTRMKTHQGSIYDEDIHYPLLLTMTKVATPTELKDTFGAMC